MNARAEIIPSEAQRAAPYMAARYEVFRICEPGKGYGDPPRTTWPLGEVPGTTLGEALQNAIAKCALAHKDHLAIRETGTRTVRWANHDEHVPYAIVHLYAIKRRSQPTYRWVGHEQVRQHDLYAAPVCIMEGGLFG